MLVVFPVVNVNDFPQLTLFPSCLLRVTASVQLDSSTEGGDLSMLGFPETKKCWMPCRRATFTSPLSYLYLHGFYAIKSKGMR